MLTVETFEHVPGLGTNKNNPDPTVYAKFFSLEKGLTWYVIEFDGYDTFFGLVKTQDSQQMDYFRLFELEESADCLGWQFEHDAAFKPMPLSQISNQSL